MSELIDKTATNPPNPNISTLRKEIKHRLVDLDLDRPGTFNIVLPLINKKLKRKKPITKNILNMAMTGFRSSEPYQEILRAYEEVLKEWPMPAA